MTDEIQKAEDIVEEWIEVVERMKKQKNSFEHLVAGSKPRTKVQDKECSKKDDCCGKC